MQKSKIAQFIYVLFIVVFVLGILCLPFIPKLYDIFKTNDVNTFSNHTLLYKAAFYSCYIICLAIIYKLIILFNKIYKESPFNKIVELSLKTIAVLFMTLFLIVIIKALFIPTLLSFAVSFVCFIASLSFYVLAEVIKSAIEYKNEIDYTV